jgi:hypothetical protein
MNPGPRNPFAGKLVAARLAAVRRASALAFARVLAFATVVSRLASALALTRVLALTGMGVSLLAHLQSHARLTGRHCSMRWRGDHSSHQAGNRCTGNYCLRFHGLPFLVVVFAQLANGTHRRESVKGMKELYSIMTRHASFTFL